MKNHLFNYSVTAFLFLCCALKISAQTFPAGFSQVKVATIYYPTSMAFAPDGRIFVTEKAGKVKIIKNGTVLSAPFLQVSVDQLNERGLSCVAIDPNFNTNHYVYVYYTTSWSPVHNRLSRFVANGDVAVAGSEDVLIDFDACVNSIHNGGGMAFGPDGKLYIGIGNDNVNSNSPDLNTYKGKVLRINPDGSVPSGNPFSGSATKDRIWAYGLRNPWTVAMQPGSGKLFVNEVGEGAWEEINDATTGGKNFGWPAAEGNSSNPAYTNPVYTYHHGPTGTTEGCAITGGAFFNPASTNYPSMYTGKYFFIDYCNKWINYLDLTSGVTKYNFASGLGGALNYIKVGTDGNLYYFSISQNALYKIIYTNNNAPQITDQPDNLTIPAGQPATFSVSASGATPMSFQWKKNGADISGANTSSYTINNAQQSDAGQYSVRVSNAYGNATSNAATLTVTGFNANPVATILTPANGSTYRSGDIINVSGDGTDAEDGTLPASAFNWTIEFHHDQHVHPGPAIPPGVKSGSFSTNFGEPSGGTWFRIILVVTDSNGLKDSANVDIHPVTSILTLMSQPTGLQLTLNQLPKTTTYSAGMVSGSVLSLGATSPQVLNGTNYVFDHWSQGGSATQNITITDNNAAYTAYYIAGGTACTASGNITREYWLNTSGTSLAQMPFSSAPSGTGALTLFEGPSNFGENYASRIRGYVCPPATGNYTFWIASDNQSELWLSTNDNPQNKVKLAYVTQWTGSREWGKYSTQQSVPVNLISGQKYYIEAIHREGTQGDNIAVGWQLPNGIYERPIPGTRLSGFSTQQGNQSPAVSITYPVNNQKFSTPVNMTIAATASDPDGNIAKVGFYNGATLLGEDLVSPYQYAWSGVTTGTYSLTAKATDNAGATTTSLPVNIEVTTCVTPTITPQGSTTFCAGGSVVLTSSTAEQYQWKKDGVNVTGATNQDYIATATGDYQVKTITGSCIAWSSPKRVTVQSCLRDGKVLEIDDRSEIISEALPQNNNELHDLLELKVFPNPTSGIFTFDINMEGLKSPQLSVIVVNSLGETIYNQSPVVSAGRMQQQIELDKNLPAGIYFLRIGIGERVETTRIILNR